MIGGGGEAAPPQFDTFFGHPKGLFVLFLTEMWERFSYFGLLALLIFYLTEHFLLSDNVAFMVFGSTMALLNGSSLLGGYLAGRFIGFHRSVLLGGILILVGHVGMTYEGPLLFVTAVDANPKAIMPDQLSLVPFQLSLVPFFISISFLVVGVGLLKPSVTILVAHLYPKDKVRKDSGYTFYVMGIAVGASLAAFVCGYLGQTYGWKYGFGAAALGMGFGLSIYIAGQRHLPSPNPGDVRYDLRPIRRLETRIGLLREAIGIFIAVVVALLLFFSLMFVGEILVSLVLVFLLSGAIFYIRHEIQRKYDRESRVRLITLSFLILMWMLYATVVEQLGSSLSLFSSRLVALDLGTIELKPSQLKGFQPLFWLFLAPAFAWFWPKLAKSNLNPSTPIKFGLAFLLLAACFGVLAVAVTHFAGPNGLVSALWVIGAYGLMAAATLCINPIGISAVTNLAPLSLVGLMIGIWYFSLSISNVLGARLAQSVAIGSMDSLGKSVADMLPIYGKFFAIIVMLCLSGAVLLFLLSPLIVRGMRGIGLFEK